MIDAQIIAVLKGGGYGFGLINMAEILKGEGITFFAVSEAKEALALREAGFEKEEILLLTPVLSKDIIEDLISENITLTASSFEVAKKYDIIAMKMERTVKIHIKVDTGFGRFGFLPENKEEILKALKLDNIVFTGIYSHLSCGFEKKYKITKQQFDKFIKVIDYLKSFSIAIPLMHIANSSAALQFPNTHLNAVRLGSAIIGRLQTKNNFGLLKVGYLESKVASTGVLPAGHNVGYANTYKTKQVTDIAVVPIGYKDGFMVEKSKDTFRVIDILRYVFNDIRSLFNKKYVSINDINCKIIGRVGMYNIIVDVTGMGVRPGDKVKLFANPLLVDSAIKREVR